MKEQPKSGGSEKVGECLYRYSSTGGYYARIKTTSKEIRRSLTTTDRDLAKRRLAKRRLAKLKDDLLKIDPANRMRDAVCQAQWKMHRPSLGLFSSTRLSKSLVRIQLLAAVLTESAYVCSYPDTIPSQRNNIGPHPN
jgi:hypothetical protein